MYKTPILFTIFNRPENTAQVFAVIKKIRPAKLYIVSDGPRYAKLNDFEQVKKTRAVVSRISWPCQVFRNYSDVNLGCRNRLISGIDWFFAHEKAGIILEDDCLPDLSFFYYCQKLLAKYRNDDRIMHIGGNNFQYPGFKSASSYYFSKYPHIWGWATWRRAWNKFDNNMDTLNQFISSGRLRAHTFNLWELLYWTIIFKNCQKKTLSAWSYNWVYTIWKHQALAIVPAVNLVKNLGLSTSATNTVLAQNFLKNMTANKMVFPLHHPGNVALHMQADYISWQRVFRVPFASVIKNIPKTVKMLLVK